MHNVCLLYTSQLRWQDKYNYDDNGNDKQNVTYIKHDAGHTKYLEKSAYLRLQMCIRDRGNIGD